MRKQTTKRLAGLIALLAPLLSWSEDDGYYFDCDVPPGNVSVWKGPVDSGKTVHVTGTIQLVEARHHGKWRPIGSILLRDAENNAAGLHMYFEWRQADKLHVHLYSGERIPLAELPMSDSKIPFELSIDPGGNLAATVAGNSKTIGLGDFNARRIQLSCSSGQFVFEQVLVKYE